MPTILDSRVYDIYSDDGIMLHHKVCEIWYRRDPVVDGVVRAHQIDLAAVNWDTMLGAWRQILTRAAQRGTLRALMYDLAEQARAEGFRAFLDALPDITPTTSGLPADDVANPFDGRLLAQRRPFLNRNAIRAALHDLASSGGTRVLIVDGPAGSGRSHIWFLVKHGCTRMGLAPNAAVRIQPSATALGGQAWGPLELANDVADALQWPRPEYDPHAQPDTHLRILARWFRTNATTRITEPCWLVIDDASSVYLTEAGLRMAAEIANAAATEEAGELRILLLGFSGLLAAEADVVAAREHIIYLDIDALKTYFHELGASVGENLGLEAIEVLMAEALGTTPCTVPLPFSQIGPSIARVANQYLQTATA